MISIVQALQKIDPSRPWTVRGNTYDDIVWEDDDATPRPSRDIVEAKLQELIDAQPWKELRTKRDRRLAQSDWVVMSDVSMSEEAKQAWLDYRQALRDLPANTADPENPVWPEAPK